MDINECIKVSCLIFIGFVLGITFMSYTQDISSLSDNTSHEYVQGLSVGFHKGYSTCYEYYNLENTLIGGQGTAYNSAVNLTTGKGKATLTTVLWDTT